MLPEDALPPRSSSHDSAGRGYYHAREGCTGDRLVDVAPPCREVVGPVHLVAILHGLPGAGKSTVAALLAASGRFKIVSFDRIWATENVHPLTASPEQCRRIYSEGLSTALRCARDSDVVIDCTSRSAAFRAVATNLLRSHGCQVVFVDCVLPAKTARARVVERLLSDPTHLGRGSRHFDTVAASFEPLSEAEFAAAPAVCLDTGSLCPKVRSHHAPGPFDEEACDVIIRVFTAHVSSNVGRDHELRRTLNRRIVGALARVLDLLWRVARRP